MFQQVEGSLELPQGINLRSCARYQHILKGVVHKFLTRQNFFED